MKKERRIDLHERIYKGQEECVNKHIEELKTKLKELQETRVYWRKQILERRKLQGKDREYWEYFYKIYIVHFKEFLKDKWFGILLWLLSRIWG